MLFIVSHRAVERRLRPSLEQRYNVTVTRLRREAVALVEEEPPDLILVDLPSTRFDVGRFFDGLDDQPLPVATFLLVGKGTRANQIPKANGYLRHPVSTRQLLQRLSRVIPVGHRETVVWCDLCLDTENRFLIWLGQQVPMTPKQADLAEVFLTTPNTVISREQLMKEVWGTDYMGDTRTLDVHIHWLRKALDELQTPFAIETERGVGYRLITT